MAIGYNQMMEQKATTTATNQSLMISGRGTTNGSTAFMNQTKNVYYNTVNQSGNTTLYNALLSADKINSQLTPLTTKGVSIYDTYNTDMAKLNQMMASATNESDRRLIQMKMDELNAQMAHMCTSTATLQEQTYSLLDTLIMNTFGTGFFGYQNSVVYESPSVQSVGFGVTAQESVTAYEITNSSADKFISISTQYATNDILWGSSTTISIGNLILNLGLSDASIGIGSKTNYSNQPSYSGAIGLSVKDFSIFTEINATTQNNTTGSTITDRGSMNAALPATAYAFGSEATYTLLQAIILGGGSKLVTQ